MSYVVFVHNTSTNLVEKFGFYDKAPMIVAQDGSSFSQVTVPPGELSKPAS